MACCQERRDNLAAIEGDLYQGQISLICSGDIKFYITGDGALTTVDTNIISCNYFNCANCSYTLYLQLYMRPTLYATLDGKTKYPVKAHRKMLNLVGFAYGYQRSEPSFGTFIGGWYFRTEDVIIKFIMYCPMKTIYTVEDDIPIVKIDDKVATCFVTRDNEIILINSDCEIIETVCIIESEPGIFRIPGGYLEYTGGDFIIDFYKIVWSYKANPALKTKPAAAQAD
jgi:hypothetical protein